MERLEDRTAPAVITVTGAGDTIAIDGLVTLREAITAANTNAVSGDAPAGDPGLDTINFNIGGGGFQSIAVTSTQLPSITEAVSINATTQTGFAGAPIIELNGSAVGGPADGFTISSAGSTIRGFVINRFNANGVLMVGVGSDGNTVAGNYIGTDAAGTASKANGGSAIRLVSGANNTIGGLNPGDGNVLSGNDKHAIHMSDPTATGNLIVGNRMGTDVSGLLAVGNGQVGLLITDGAHGNTVGGTTAAARNIISASGVHGIRINDPGSDGNVISGNYIGTNATGTAALPNAGSGIVITDKASNNVIGGSVPGAGNLISGNDTVGVNIFVAGTTGNVVAGNLIGTDVTGTLALGNTAYGVQLSGSASGNTIGGMAAGAGNTISGNGLSGVHVSGSATTGNNILGNFIGTNLLGTAAIGNAESGVLIENDANGNVLGSVGGGNVISGNGGDGVVIDSNGAVGDTDNNQVLANFIGTNKAGTAAIPNAGDGVRVKAGAVFNTIGAAGAGNVISGNLGNGVSLSDSQVSDNVVRGNFIGTNAAGTVAIPNSLSGVQLGSSDNNTIGGLNAGDGNLISGNTLHGVFIIGSNATANLIIGNRIGTDVTGSLDLGNTQSGVAMITGAHNNTVGGTTAAERNIISGNGTHGVRIIGGDGNVILGNYIGTTIAGNVALPNDNSGVVIDGGSSNNTVGGSVAGARNIISGNITFGVNIFGSGTTGNIVAGNYIGLDVTGTVAMGNTANGVRVSESASGNTIGGPAGNVISANGDNGVALSLAATGNSVTGNFIGTNASGTAAVPNADNGIQILNGASNNTIGGASAAARNLISGNTNRGVLVSDPGTNGNVVQGNYIGTDVTGMLDLGNGDAGIRLQNQVSNTTIGGLTATPGTGLGNVVSGNNQRGVSLTDVTGTTIQGNLIGTNRDGTGVIQNGFIGVVVGASVNTVLGGLDTKARNVISGNHLTGVNVTGAGTSGTLILNNYIGTTIDGSAPLGNGGTGVLVDGGTGTVVGAPGAGNVIAASEKNGVWLHGVSGAVVQGNWIGTDVTGKALLGNASSGVRVSDGATGNTIGGGIAAEGNVIAFNLGAGVSVEGDTNPAMNTTVRLNSIYKNYGLGIDLDSDRAVSLNDLNDTDTGANGLLNYPVINGASIGDAGLIVSGFAPDGTVLDFYATDDVPDVSGFGQGKTYLGSYVVESSNTGTYGPKPFLGVLIGTDTTNTFTFIKPALELPEEFGPGTLITATAWDGANSSEFGNNVPVEVTELTLTLNPSTVVEGGRVTLKGAFPADGPRRTHTVLVDWGDGTTDIVAVRRGRTHFTARHRYLDDDADNQYTITATVIDDVTAAAQSQTIDVTVNNAAPRVRIVQIDNNSDASQVTLAARVTDRGVLDTFTYQWTILDSDGTAVGTSTGETFTFNRTPGVSSRIRVEVTDDDTGVGKDRTTILSFSNSDDGVTVTDADVDAGTDRLIVLALDGDDDIDASGMTLPVEIVGGDGNDTLTTGSGEDILDDGHGDDTLTGGTGDDTYRLTPGSDDVLNEDDDGGRDRIDFSRAEGGITFSLDKDGEAQTVSGTSTVTANGTFEDLKGSRFADNMKGSALGNELYGGLGTDTIEAGAGDDIIYGGAEPGDTLPTGIDDDIIFGGLGSDTVVGGDGDDIIYGEVAPGDTVSPGDADDIIFGGVGLDTIDGGDGNDIIYGGAEPGDTTSAADGDDIIYGSVGEDTIVAGAGDDIIYGEVAPGDTMPAGATDDIIFGGAGMDTIVAGEGDDIIYGGTEADTIDAGIGNDIIFGGTDNDTVAAGTGNDIIFGGTGSDSIAADTGDDIIFGGAPAHDTVPTGLDDDIIYGGEGSDTITAGIDDDIIYGDVGPGETIGTGAHDDIVYGGIGNDTIDAGIGDDIIFGEVAPGDTLPIGNGDDIIYGEVTPDDSIPTGIGDDIIFGGVGNDTIDAGIGDDIIFGGVDQDLLRVTANSDLTVTGDVDAGQVVGTGGTTDFAEIERVALTGGSAPNLLDATGLDLPAILAGAGGNDTLLGGSHDDVLEGGTGDDSLRGGGGNDTYEFRGGGLGSDTIDELPGGGADGADFREFAGPVTIDLSLSTQVVNPTHLTLTLTLAAALENTFGSVYSDQITGNAMPNHLIGGGGQDVLLGGGGADTLRGNVTQVVFLDFDSRTDSHDHQYEADERQDIRDRIAADYAQFDIEVTLTRPTSGPYVTLFFNDLPLEGRPEVFGLADGLDWRNTRLSGSAVLDLNFLANAPDTDNKDDFIAASALVGAHELGHLLGLRHWDAFGPIGEGIYRATRRGAFLPRYEGPKTANGTPNDLMASPRSVGVDDEAVLSNPHIGQRSAVKLAFADTGLVVAEQPGEHNTPETAQVLTLAGLTVPNTHPSQSGSFTVTAVSVTGRIDLAATGKNVSENDYYRFAGTAGAVLNVQLMSEALFRNTDVIDSILRVYDPSGVLIFENDDGFEPTDSIVIDLILPTSGVYTIEVDTFTSDLVPDEDTGVYELFMYTFAAGASLGEGDWLEGGTGDDTIFGSSGTDRFVFSGTNLDSDTIVAISGNGEGILDLSGLAGGVTVDLGFTGPQVVNADLTLTILTSHSIKTVIGTGQNDIFSGDDLDNVFVGGSGTDRVVETRNNDFTLTGSTLTGDGTDTLVGIEEVALTGGAGANTFTVSGWGGLVQLDGAGGGDEYVVGFGGLGKVTVHDSGSGVNDHLFINGTPASDLVTIASTSVSLDGESVEFDVTVDEITIDGLTGTNQAKFIEPVPAVPVELINFGGPTIGLSGPAGVDDGILYTLTLGLLTNIAPSAVADYTIDWGDGTPPQTFSGSPPAGTQKTHAYPGSTNTVYTVTVSLTIGGTPIVAGTLPVASNLAPVVGAITAPLAPQLVNTPITATASFTDAAGLLDAPYTATWDWGDGTTPETVPVPAGSFTVSRNHAYTAAGVYTITLTVTDKDGGSGQSTFQYVVVYNPQGGSVSVGGWFNSPPGAYPANPSYDDKAHVGVSARYQSGASVPTGNFNFHLQHGFKFKSTGFDWLVITGPRARLQGSGKIDGAGNYGFLLSVIDGNVSGGGGVDRVRVKIWDKITNAIVYDNLPGAPDTDDPVTPHGGGNIVIQGGSGGLLAGPAAPADRPTQWLTSDLLAPLVHEAVARWLSAGITADQAAALAGASVFVVDLPDGYLGLAADNTVWLDVDAAGHGWFLDPTPADDSEFRTWTAPPMGIDLLSVIAHEFGHLIGHEHDGHGGVMAETLSPGVRHMPSPDGTEPDGAADAIVPVPHEPPTFPPPVPFGSDDPAVRIAGAEWIKLFLQPVVSDVTASGETPTPAPVARADGAADVSVPAGPVPGGGSPVVVWRPHPSSQGVWSIDGDLPGDDGVWVG